MFQKNGLFLTLSLLFQGSATVKLRHRNLKENDDPWEENMAYPCADAVLNHGRYCPGFLISVWIRNTYIPTSRYN